MIFPTLKNSKFSFLEALLHILNLLHRHFFHQILNFFMNLFFWNIRFAYRIFLFFPLFSSTDLQQRKWTYVLSLSVFFQLEEESGSVPAMSKFLSFISSKAFFKKIIRKNYICVNKNKIFPSAVASSFISAFCRHSAIYDSAMIFFSYLLFCLWNLRQLLSPQYLQRFCFLIESSSLGDILLRFWLVWLCLAF